MPEASTIRPTQRARAVAVSTPLGEDVLLLRRMSGREALGRPFELNLSLFSERTDLRFDELLGQSVTVRVDLPNGGRRHFNGMVSHFSQGLSEGRFAHYEATLRPWVWFLTRRADCRIYQGKSIPEIISDVFGRHDFSDFEDNLSGSYRTWQYCVQYRETDFNFVSRLMEQEGIYYYFRHADDKHTLVLSDSISSHDTVAGYETIPYYPPEARRRRERDHIHDWRLTRQVQPGAYALTDFDFTRPKANLGVRSSTPHDHLHAGLELFDYPGEYAQSRDGEAYARLRLEELHAEYERASGVGNAAGLAVGALFTLENFPREDQNREHLILEAEYEIVSDAYESARGLAADGGEPFSCSFTAMDRRVPFRPARITPKPLIQGPQTAIVVGPAGDEIHTDQYGRVKVHFHWDRHDSSDEYSSCFVRVSHPWAGKSWGAVSIPRIGQEVIVDFLEGDPDQPIITGRVYNGENMPPYGLPAGAVISGVKSNSTKGGGGYNEYVLDDTKGNELIREHGQYDKDSTLEHDLREHVLNCRSRDVAVDETISIGNNRSLTVGVNETTSIGSNRTETVGANESIAVGQNRTRTVGSNETVTVALTRTHSVGVNEMINVGAAQEVTIGGVQTVTVGATRTLSVGLSQSTDVGKDLTLSVSQNLSETVKGKHDESVTKEYSLKAKKVLVTADDEIVLKTGQSTITMKKNGDIKISGKKIEIAAMQDVKVTGMNITGEAQVKNVVKGTMVNAEASGIATIKGSLVKIN
jgi:type VI secretion system secreted protein VgrG